MNPIDPASIPQRVVDAAIAAQPVCEPWEAAEIIAAALTALMDDKPVMVDEHGPTDWGVRLLVRPCDVLAAVLAPEAA